MHGIFWNTMVNKVNGTIIKGYGVASGSNGDPRFPGGTIAMQIPFFRDLGLDLSAYFKGTVNVDISPAVYEIIKPRFSFQNLNWTPSLQPENFFFFDLSVEYMENKYEGYIYMPDPGTKEEHFQPGNSLELLLPEIEGIRYGNKILVKVRTEQMIFIKK